MSPPLLLLLFFSSSFELADTSNPLQNGHSRVKRQLAVSAVKWPNNQVTYEFGTIDSEGKAIVRQVMDYISARTCIKYKADANADKRIVINGNIKTCSSYLGQPQRKIFNTVNIGDCYFIGTALHEFLHSLGSIHEQSRPDRDKWIHVNKTAAEKAGVLDQVAKEEWGKVDIYVPFDYGSVMLYAVNAFADGIMLPVDAKYEYTMGDYRIGFYDIQAINKHYNCKCKTNLACLNGGYTNPSSCSACICPSGFTGATCDQRYGSYNLNALPSWQSRTYQFNSPGQASYTSLKNFQYFYIYISVPVGKKVEILVEKWNGLRCEFGCPYNGVEIKTNSDSRATSPVVCCPNKQPFAKKSFISSNNPTIIQMYTRIAQMATISFRFRAV